MEEIIHYALSFLLRDDPFYTEKVGYTANPDEWERYAVVIIPSTFFEKDYGKAESLPSNRPALLDGLPVLYGENRMERHTHPRGETLLVYADFVASAYFMISRYEEWLRPEVRDTHGRFPGRESWAARAGFIDRPLVDEYGFWLKTQVDALFCPSAGSAAASTTTAAGSATTPAPSPNAEAWRSGLKRIYLTHDVDTPFLYRSLRGMGRLLRDGGGLRSLFRLIFSHKFQDPFDTFSTISSLDHSLKATLNREGQDPVVQDVYFIKSLGTSPYDYPRYRLRSRGVSRLGRRLKRQGSLIGLHVSYAAGGAPARIEKEKRHLERSWGLDKVSLSRHHYLRFCEPAQAAQLAQNGLTDDFSMGFADLAGFRLGTARSVRAIDPALRRLTPLLYHPLLCMDSSLFDPRYMHLDEAKARQTLFALIDRAAAVGGEVSLLWHNTSFMVSQSRPTDGNAAPNAAQSPHTGRLTLSRPIPGTDPALIAPDTPLRLYAEACAHLAARHGAEFKPHLRILLICDAFPPASAPRMGYLTRYLQEMGHEVTVLTEKALRAPIFDFLRGNTEVHEFAFPHFLKAHFGPKNKYRVLYKAGQQLCEQRPFDLILCSTYRTFPLPVATRLSRRFALPLVADLRDIVEEYPDLGFIEKLPQWGGLETILGRFYGLLQIKKRNRNLRHAASLISISDWHTAFLIQLCGADQNVSTIANGYDPTLYTFSPLCAPTFDIVYTGRIVSRIQRDPTLLLQALEKGLQQHAAWASDTRLVFYSDTASHQIISEMAAHLAPSLPIVSGSDSVLSGAALVLNPGIPSNQIPKILNQSSVILILTTGLSHASSNTLSKPSADRLEKMSAPCAKNADHPGFNAHLNPERHPYHPAQQTSINSLSNNAQSDNNHKNTQEENLLKSKLYRPWRWFLQRPSKRQPHGILTTKLFEALGVDKPILCVRSDEDVIAALLKENGQGCAATTVEEVEAFLSAAHAQWKAQGYTHTPGSPALKERYRRDRQAQAFEQIFLNILSWPKR